MRFSIIYLMSLLIVPTLVASKEQAPPPTPNNSPSRSHQPPHSGPAHGDIVHYQGWAGPRLGVVVGSQRSPARNINIAPLTPGSPHPPAPVRTYQRQIVNAPPGHVVRTGHTAQSLASTLEREHTIIPPFSYSTPGPIRGSPNHRPAQLNGGNKPGERAGGR